MDPEALDYAMDHLITMLGLPLTKYHSNYNCHIHYLQLTSNQFNHVININYITGYAVQINIISNYYLPGKHEPSHLC